MFRDKLFECDEEGRLDCNAPRYGSGPENGELCQPQRTILVNVQSAITLAGFIEEYVDQKAKGIGYNAGNQNELGKVLCAPGSFEVSSAEEYSETRNNHAKDVLFNESGSDESPWILERCTRDQREQGRALACAIEELKRAI